MKNAEEMVILVTRATDCLGRLVARDLAAGGGTVLIHGRSEERAEIVVCEICKETGNEKLGYYLTDFSSLEEVR